MPITGASDFALLQNPRAQGIHPNGLSPLQIAVVNLLFILYEISHLFDNYKTHETASTLLKELYYIGGDAHVKTIFIQFLKHKYQTDNPFEKILLQLMTIFDTAELPVIENIYVTAMNSLKHLFENISSLPVSLPEGSLPPQVPNEWVQKERDLMDQINDALTAEEDVTNAKSATDLPFPLQYYTRIFKKGIDNLQPLFEHAKTNPSASYSYDGINDSFKNALQKVQELFKERSPVKSAARQRSRSPATNPRRSERLRKEGGLRKIKTVRRHTPNKHKKNKSRRG